MSEFFNQLLPAEEERLVILMETMAEVTKTIGKAFREGYDGKDLGANRKRLEQDLGSVMCILDDMFAENDVSRKAVAEEAMKEKLSNRILHFQG
jgi:hypothetical protein